MSESSVGITEGSGRRFHTWQRSIGGTAVQDAFQLPGEPPAATYTAGADTVAMDDANSHLLQLTAGVLMATTVEYRFLRVRRIVVAQKGTVVSGSSSLWVVRLTRAGTGGTSVTPSPLDFSGDDLSLAECRILPSTKGTEGEIILHGKIGQVATDPSDNGNYWEWQAAPGTKGIVIPPLRHNGIAIKLGAARVGNSVAVYVEYTETAWLGA